MPDQADQLVATALTHLRRQRWADAEAAAQAALAIRANHPDALHVLGVVAWQTGRLDDAVRFIVAAIAIAPRYAEAHKNLGIVFSLRGEHDQAVACFRRAVEIEPNLAEAHFHLATLRRESGDVAGAIDLYRRVIALDPRHPEAHNDLGAALKDSGRLAEAIASFRCAIELRPDHVVALVNLGGALMDHGEPATAREFFRRARDLAPARADARFGYCLSFIPIAYANGGEIAESRAAYSRELRELVRHYAEFPQELAAAAASAGSHLPFYLAYQGEDDRELQQTFGQLFAGAMAARFPTLAAPPPRPARAPGEPVRVGMLSGYFRSHSVWKLFGGWVRDLDRGRFRLHGYSTSRRADAETARAKSAFDVFVETSENFQALAETIRSHRLHVLLFPEIGMDQTTARLAALRLAPVQAVAWGHPETSGLPTVDYFLSSELMEPADGDRFYSEKLIRLPNLSIDYAPLAVTPKPPDLARFGVRTGAVKYLCCQSLYKYLPRNDDVFVAIARAVPEAQFLFIQHFASPQVTELTRSRIGRAFAAAGLDPDRHLVFLRPLGQAEYAGLNAAADVYLDSLEWSGGNTTLEAVAAGLPIVTLPGPLMRGRHSAAILTMMGSAETVARDKDEYVALAVRLGRDPVWRREIAANVVARRDRLYHDRTPVKALEELLVRWAG